MRGGCRAGEGSLSSGISPGGGTPGRELAGRKARAAPGRPPRGGGKLGKRWPALCACAAPPEFHFVTFRRSGRAAPARGADGRTHGFLRARCARAAGNGGGGRRAGGGGVSPAPSRTRGTWLCAGCHASVRFRGAALAPRSPQARAGGGVGAEGQPRPRSPALLPPPDGVPRPPWPTSGSPLTRPPPPALPDLGALSAGGRPPSPTGAQPGAAPPGTARGGPGEGRCLCPPRCPGSAAPRWPLPAVPAASVPGRRRGLGRDAERGGLRWEDGLPGPGVASIVQRGQCPPGRESTLWPPGSPRSFLLP